LSRRSGGPCGAAPCCRPCPASHRRAAGDGLRRFGRTGAGFRGRKDFPPRAFRRTCPGRACSRPSRVPATRCSRRIAQRADHRYQPSGRVDGHGRGRLKRGRLSAGRDRQPDAAGARERGAGDQRPAPGEPSNAGQGRCGRAAPGHRRAGLGGHHRGRVPRTCGPAARTAAHASRGGHRPVRPSIRPGCERQVMGLAVSTRGLARSQGSPSWIPTGRSGWTTSITSTLPRAAAPLSGGPSLPS
jgi:hypothetical protein